MSGPVRIREYQGETQQDAWETFQRDAAEGTRHGWEPVDHHWEPRALRVTYRPQAASGPRGPVGKSWQPLETDSDYAFVDRALESPDRIEVKLALQDVRREKAKLSQIKKQASQAIAVIRSDYSRRVAEHRWNRNGGSMGPFARASQTAQSDPDRKAVDAAIRAYIAQADQADALMRTADKAILQLQRRLMDIGPG
jgi:hypothetical protein